MQLPKIKGLSDNQKIKAIGGLFRNLSDSEWNINLKLDKNNEIDLPISYAALLVRDRLLNNTEKQQQSGLQRSIKIKSTQSWNHLLLEEYPNNFINNMDRSQHCFCFNDNGLQIFLPQFELARVLFLNNAYLSRVALSPDALNIEFEIQYLSPEHAYINILPTANYAVKLLNDNDAQRKLSWILLDQDMRKSFASIGSKQILNGIDNKNRRTWDFEFIPPLLQGVELDVRCFIDNDYNCMFVREIVSVKNIKVGVNFPKKVEFHHPEFKDYEKGNGSKRGNIMPRPNDEHIIDAKADANSDNQHIIKQIMPVIFEFSSIFETRKVSQKRYTQSSTRQNENADSLIPGQVSMNEPTTIGTLPCSELNAEKDVTDDTSLYRNKFDQFHEMIKQLRVSHHCEIKSDSLRKLPKVPRCKKHLLEDSKPRYIAVVEIACKGKHFHIIEVDTSDAKNALSTQLLRINAPDQWQKGLEKLERELVKNSLRWPNDVLKNLCGDGRYAGVPHPPAPDSTQSQEEADKVIAHWAERFYGWMEKLN